MKNLTREYLKLYENCIYNSNENIVKLSVNAVKNTLMHIGDKLSCDEWITVIEFFDKLFKITTPNKVIYIYIYIFFSSSFLFLSFLFCFFSLTYIKVNNCINFIIF